jgi:two-component system, chemotaxis family, protein-glutamate methylesterase/glutaminase
VSVAERLRPPFPDTNFDVVAFASSAGGLNALMATLTGLPGDFPAAVVVVQHLDPHHPSVLAALLDRKTALSTKQAEPDDTLQPGLVLIAPPDHHLLVNADGTVSLTQTELVHYLRPSADLLFESVAAGFKSRAIGVVLSGTGADGSMGVRAIKTTGGTLIAQDEASSEFFGMPGAAARTGLIDHVLPLVEITPMLVKLVTKDEG